MLYFDRVYGPESARNPGQRPGFDKGDSTLFFDPTYMFFVMLPTLALSLFAQWRVKSAYKKWSRVPNQQGLNSVAKKKRTRNFTKLHASIGGGLLRHFLIVMMRLIG